MEIRTKWFLLFLFANALLLYSILGYRIELVFTPIIKIEVGVSDVFVSMFVVLVSLISIFICVKYKQRGYTFHEDYSFFYFWFTLVSLYAYTNMWLTEAFWLSILLSFVGIGGVILVYLKGV